MEEQSPISKLTIYTPAAGPDFDLASEENNSFEDSS